MNKLQSAIKYANSGYSVLPINGKHPLIKFADRPSLTIDQINYYWGKYPNTNIAIRTTDFFVLDIDTKKAHGTDGMKSYQTLKNTGLIVPTLAQITASGGYQLFYKKPTASHIKQVIGLKEGVDVKAHVNNYVIVPPSTTEKGIYQWINQSPMKDPHPKLVELINSHHPPKTYSSNWNNQRTTGKKWTGIVLDNIVQGAPEGKRNDYLTRLCGQLIHAGAENNTVWTLLNYANQFNSPPLEEREVGKIVASILKEELRK